MNYQYFLPPAPQEEQVDGHVYQQPLQPQYPYIVRDPVPAPTPKIPGIKCCVCGEDMRVGEPAAYIFVGVVGYSAKTGQMAVVEDPEITLANRGRYDVFDCHPWHSAAACFNNVCDEQEELDYLDATEQADEDEEEEEEEEVDDEPYR